jgi:SPOR domain
MNGVEFGIARRWELIGITRTSRRSVLALSLVLAALLMFAAAKSAEAEPSQPASGSEYVVQVSSQRSEEDAQASYKALQSKYPTLLAERAPIIKRADHGGHGVYYRAAVGPFDTAEEASQFCDNLRTAGGFCVIQKK